MYTDIFTKLPQLFFFTFMSPCIIRISQYISNKMQHSLFYLETALNILCGTSTHHHLSHCYCYLPLAAGSSNSSIGVTNTRYCRKQLYVLLMMGGGTTQNMYSSFQIK
jgi:hypothetical protein